VAGLFALGRMSSDVLGSPMFLPPVHKIGLGASLGVVRHLWDRPSVLVKPRFAALYSRIHFGFKKRQRRS
jgi:hypothetical protein